MAILPFDKLSAGMVLKKNVCDRSGRLLLPEGAELGEKHLRIFQTWGISEADIVCDDENDEQGDATAFDNVDPQLLEQVSQHITGIFSYNDLEDPIIRELLRLCIARKVSNGC